jgi:subtilase family serine protease
MFIVKKIIHLLFMSSLFILSAHAGQKKVASPGLELLSKATYIKPLAPEQVISFMIRFPLRNKKELDRLVQEVYDPNSPRYHQFLTSAIYEQEFAPAPEVEAKVQEFFINQGMQVEPIHHSLRVTGTVAQIEHTLQVQLNYYQYQHEVVYANANAPKLNAEIASYIAEISGLSIIPQFQSRASSKKPETKKIHDLNFNWIHFVPLALPTNLSLQGFTGANLQAAYNIGNIPVINGVAIDGSGQTLVVVDKCGTNTPQEILSDANQYFNTNGINPFVTSGQGTNFSIINPDGTPYTTCSGGGTFSQEILLDIESSHTLAPGNNTVLVLGTDQRSILIDVIETLLQNNYNIGGFANAFVISNSWGGAETTFDTTLESTLELAAAAGISVNFSSGDCGDNTYDNQKKCTTTWPAPTTVEYPASSAYATAVGATSLFVDNNYSYAFETVWGTVKTLSGTLSFDGGTGGGISQLYGPVSWQNTISQFTAGGYGVINTFGSRRALPDIAMLGDPNTGLLIVAQGAMVQDGGTSLACPLFSATLVLVNQARALLSRGTPIGQAAPYLYQNNQILLSNRAINLIIPPAVIISGATPPPATIIHGTPAPASSFTLGNITFGWDSSLTVEPEAQFWNDAIGIGSPNIPNFVLAMSTM